MTLCSRVLIVTAEDGSQRQKKRCMTKPKENSWLRLQVEKYKRIANASSRAFIGQQKIIANQSRIIADLRKELAKLKKLTKC